RIVLYDSRSLRHQFLRALALSTRTRSGKNATRPARVLRKPHLPVQGPLAQPEARTATPIYKALHSDKARKPASDFLQSTSLADRQDAEWSAARGKSRTREPFLQT